MDAAGLLNYYDASYTTAAASSTTAWYQTGEGAAGAAMSPDTERQPNLQWTLPKVRLRRPRLPTPTSLLRNKNLTI
jgi:hypothetical protein